MTKRVDKKTSLPAEATQLIAHARNDITIPMFSAAMRPLDDTLIQRGGGKGLKIYDEIERDTYAHAVLQKRKFALIARDWTVEPASNSARDQQAAKFIGEQLDAMNFDQLCLDLLDATLKGYAVAEIVWRRDGAAVVPDRIVTHEQRRFVFDVDWQPRLLTVAAPGDGEPLPERKFIVHRFGVKGNNPYGIGLGSKLFWPVLFKREGVAFWMTFLEKFASPTPVGKYPTGTLPADQEKMLQTLRDMVQSGAIVVPLGSDVNFLEAARSGNASYLDWCRYWDEQVALAVFGSTLGTQIQGSGSRAAAETHKETEEQIIDADADLLSDTLRNTLVKWLVEYNLPGAGIPSVRRPRPQKEAEHEDLRGKRATNAAAELRNLFDVMGRLPGEHAASIADRLADGELLPKIPADVLADLARSLAHRPAPAMAAPKNSTVLNAGSAELAESTGLSALVDQVAHYATPMTDKMLATVRKELIDAGDTSETLEQARDRLLKSFADIEIDPLGNVLANALTLAELTGRADVLDETR